MINKPAATGTWLDRYVNLVPDTSLIDGFKRQTQETLNLLSTLNDAEVNFRYAEGKWNLKEMMVHLIDTERIFAFRAMAFARSEKQALPGYDENEYVKNSHADTRDWRSLLEEFIVVRTCTVATFAGFHPSVLNNIGTANNMLMPVAALGFAILGHEMHHINIIQTRYLVHSNQSSAN